MINDRITWYWPLFYIITHDWRKRIKKTDFQKDEYFSFASIIIQNLHHKMQLLQKLRFYRHSGYLVSRILVVSRSTLLRLIILLDFISFKKNVTLVVTVPKMRYARKFWVPKKGDLVNSIKNYWDTLCQRKKWVLKKVYKLFKGTSM